MFAQPALHVYKLDGKHGKFMIQPSCPSNRMHQEKPTAGQWAPYLQPLKYVHISERQVVVRTSKTAPPIVSKHKPFVKLADSQFPLTTANIATHHHV